MSKLDDLEKLDMLMKNGTITQNEFQQEKEKILMDNNRTKQNATDKSYLVGFTLSVCSVIFVFISFYASLGITVIDMLVATILNILAILENYKLKKHRKGKNIFINISIIISIVSLILFIPNLFNFIKNFELYVNNFKLGIL